MIVIPAIDIIGGQAVRLYKGDYSKKRLLDKRLWILPSILMK